MGEVSQELGSMSAMIPIIVTSASGTPVRTESTTVKQIRWIGATDAGDECIIKDPDDNILWDSVAAGASYVEADTLDREWPEGFKVTTLDSGVLRIYTERGKSA